MYAVRGKSDGRFPLKAIEYGVTSPSIGYCPCSQGSFGCTLLLSFTSFIFIAPFSQVPHHLHYLDEASFLLFFFFPSCMGIFFPLSYSVAAQMEKPIWTIRGQAMGIT
ncbi:hypothetical protein CEXT_313971 [Caerostris extrusa]|uniref:Uncharacterized protein n=1 Tax=Caerostris extrusa TaxID=172846 RepID=A0AAV4PCQ9_CAEEX|nr:hypothetical protein CEXT_313971 [Caerostris extrusa]